MSNSESKYEVFSGYTIHDCLIAGPEYFVISSEKILSEEEYDYYENRGSTRLGIHNPSKQPIGEPIVWATRTWEQHSFYNTRLINTKSSEYLMMDDAGQVFYGGLGDRKFIEDRIPPDQRCRQLTKVGDQIYGIGFGRKILKRIDHGQWEHLVPSEIRSAIPSGQAGFDDMHGFSETDLYAAGGKSDVWHYDGEQWRFVDICDDPILPKAVCCAEDGFVYIACAHGVLVRGRGEEWDVFHTDKNIKFCDTVAYNGRVFFGSESGVFVSQQNTEAFSCQPYDFEGQIAPLNARRLDAGHGLLLAASLNSVALYDGENWQYLYGGGPTPKEEALLLEMLAREAEQDLDELTELADQLKSVKGQG